MSEAQLGERIALDPLRDPAELRGKRRRRRGREVQEHEATPALDRRRIQAELRFVELGRRAQVRRGHELPVEVVSPLMIGAGDAPGGDASGERRLRSRLGGVAAQARAAVPAHVVEGPQLARAVAHQQEALAEDIEHTPCAGLGELLLARDADPVAAEDALLLERKDALRGVPARGECRLEAGNPRRERPRAHGSNASGASRRWASVPGAASSSRA
jgi:hypothetical protein